MGADFTLSTARSARRGRGDRTRAFAARRQSAGHPHATDNASGLEISHGPRAQIPEVMRCSGKVEQARWHRPTGWRVRRSTLAPAIYAGAGARRARNVPRPEPWRTTWTTTKALTKALRRSGHRQLARAKARRAGAAHSITQPGRTCSGPVDVLTRCGAVCGRFSL